MTRICFNIGILKSMPLFSLMAGDELACLLPWLQHRSYRTRSFIIRAGEAADGLYFMLSGTAAILLEDGDGRSVLVRTLGANEFCGEMGLIDGGPRSASVQARSACEVIYVPKKHLFECLERNFNVAMFMFRAVVERLREANRRIEGLALQDVYGRVGRVLLECSREVNGDRPVEPGSEQIAAMVGASREMVSRVLAKMIDTGLVRRQRRMLFVVDPTRLAERVQLHKRGSSSEVPVNASKDIPVDLRQDNSDRLLAFR